MQSINFDSFSNEINTKPKPKNKIKKQYKHVFFVDFHSNGAKTPTRYYQQTNKRRKKEARTQNFL